MSRPARWPLGHWQCWLLARAPHAVLPVPVPAGRCQPSLMLAHLRPSARWLLTLPGDRPLLLPLPGDQPVLLPPAPMTGLGGTPSIWLGWRTTSSSSGRACRCGKLVAWALHQTQLPPLESLWQLMGNTEDSLGAGLSPSTWTPCCACLCYMNAGTHILDRRIIQPAEHLHMS